MHVATDMGTAGGRMPDRVTTTYLPFVLRELHRLQFNIFIRELEDRFSLELCVFRPTKEDGLEDLLRAHAYIVGRKISCQRGWVK